MKMPQKYLAGHLDVAMFLKQEFLSHRSKTRSCTPKELAPRIKFLLVARISFILCGVASTLNAKAHNVVLLAPSLLGSLDLLHAALSPICSRTRCTKQCMTDYLPADHLAGWLIRVYISSSSFSLIGTDIGLQASSEEFIYII